MKKLLLTALLLIGLISNAQLQVNLGIDPKIAILGTDNQYTSHDALFNYEVKLEYLKETINNPNNKIYFNVNYKFVNLEQKYHSIGFGIGYQTPRYLFNQKLLIVPQIQAERITRDIYNGNRASVITLKGITSIRLPLDRNERLQLGFSPYVQWSRDIGKTFRYGSNVELIIKVF